MLSAAQACKSKETKMENIHRIVYINLAQRPDRRKEVLAELSRLGVREDKIVRFEAVPTGLSGCNASHAGVLQMALDLGWPNVLILEDDFNFVEDAEYVEKALLHFFSQAEAWDCVQLATGSVRETRQDDFLSRVEEGTNAAGYLVNRPAMAKLQAVIFGAVEPLRQTGQHWTYMNDIVWREVMKDGRWFAFAPALGYQRYSYSDLAGRCWGQRGDPNQVEKLNLPEPQTPGILMAPTSVVVGVVHFGGAHHKNRLAVQKGCQALNLRFMHTECSNELLRIVTLEQGSLLIWAADQFLEPSAIPERHCILMGPHLWVFPQHPLAGPRDEQRFPARRVRYSVPGQWVQAVNASLGDVVVQQLVQPFGLDLDAWVPDSKREVAPLPGYPWRVLVYFKERHPSLLQMVQAALDRMGGHIIRVVSYGSYSEEEYKANLRWAHFGVWVGRHESQGFACLEASLMNLPLAVWDVTSMHEEWRGGKFTYCDMQQPLLATVVPYWSSSKGELFYQLGDFEKTIQTLETRIEQALYNPRDGLECLSPERCLEAVLKEFNLMAPVETLL